MNYLKNALQNNQKNDDFFDFTTTKKSHTIKMPIGKTGRSFDVEIDDEVLGEFFKKQQYKTTAENLSPKQTINGADTNEFTDIFSLPKAEYDALFAPQNIGQSQRQNAVNKVQQDEPTDIFSLPKAEYDALFAPQKPATRQGIYQNNRQNAQQSSMSNYAVSINPNMGQSLQPNTQKAIGNNNITPDKAYPDRELIYQNPLLKQSQNTTLNESQASAYKNFMLDTPQAIKKIEYNEGRGYPNKAKPHPSEKQGKKRILVVTAEGINSKKEDGKREEAWDVLRKQLESYGDFEVDMPQDLSFYDYDGPHWLNKILNSSLIIPVDNSLVDETLRRGENVLETFSKGIAPLGDKDAQNNAKAINNYINDKVTGGNISDYYDGIFLVGYSGGGESADAIATILSEQYNIDVNNINKMGAPSFIGPDFEKLNEKTFNIAFRDDKIFNHLGTRENPASETEYMDDKIEVEENQNIHKAYIATPEATEIAMAEITKKIRSYFKEKIDFANSTQKYLKRKGAIDKYGQTNSIL